MELCYVGKYFRLCAAFFVLGNLPLPQKRSPEIRFSNVVIDCPPAGHGPKQTKCPVVRNFHRKVLSNVIGISDVCLEMSSDFKYKLSFLVDKFSELVQQCVRWIKLKQSSLVILMLITQQKKSLTLQVGRVCTFIQFNTDNFQAHQSHGYIQKYNRLDSSQEQQQNSPV